MTYVALFALALLALCVITFSGLILKQERRHSRRIDSLLDRLAHAQGRTWTPPPVAENEEEFRQFAESHIGGFDPFQEPD